MRDPSRLLMAILAVSRGYGLMALRVLSHDESRHLCRTSMRRIERSDIHEADVVAVTVSHALCPLPEFFTIPFKAMAGVAQLAGGHAMQDVVFLVWRGNQYRLSLIHI